MTSNKECKDCNKVKNITCFYSRIRSNNSIYVTPTCKDCIKLSRKQLYNSDKDKYKEISKVYYNKNSTKINENKKIKRDKNPDIFKEYCKKYNEKTQERKKCYNKMYYENNKEYIKQQTREYRIKNIEKVRTYFKNYVKNRAISDPNFRLSKILRTRVNTALCRQNTNKCESTVELIDCSIHFFKYWIEFQFDDKMSWCNYGSYWNIDHVTPCAFFDLTIKKQQQLCFNWRNCRPLEKNENSSKGALVIEIQINLQEQRVISYLQHIQTAGNS